MTPSGAEFIKQVKAQIEEVDPGRRARARCGKGVAIIDVRESDEWDAGHLPGAKHVPRGYLESRIEGAAPDRSPARDPLLRLGQPLARSPRRRCATTSATSTSSR